MTVSDGRTDVLIVGASAPDLVGLRAQFGDSLEGAVRGLVVRSKVIGFGAGVAGATTARGLLAIQPRAVIQIGTCGVYPNQADYRPYDVIVPTKVLALDHAVLRGQAAWPPPMQTTFEPSPAIVAGLATGRMRTFAVPVASPLAFTTDDNVAAQVRGLVGADAESMDVLGVASAAVGANIPFACVLGVTNIVGSTALRDWNQFKRDAVIQAAGAVFAWLHAGAVGLPFA
jgi:nucleoside phosphorylase